MHQTSWTMYPQKMEAGSYYKTCVNCYQSKWHHGPEDLNHYHHCKNCKSCTIVNMSITFLRNIFCVESISMLCGICFC